MTIMNKVYKCDVCGERDATGMVMCVPCSVAYDRALSRHDDLLCETIEWVARRARRFERKRKTSRNP